VPAVLFSLLSELWASILAMSSNFGKITVLNFSGAKLMYSSTGPGMCFFKQWRSARATKLVSDRETR
jgi:hypothetical protein